MSIYHYILSIFLGIHFLLFVQHLFLFFILVKKLQKERILNLSYALFNLSFVLSIFFMHLLLLEDARLTSTLVLIHATISVFFTYYFLQLYSFKKPILICQAAVTLVYIIDFIAQTPQTTSLFFICLIVYAIGMIIFLTVNIIINKKNLITVLLYISFILLYLSYILSSVGDFLDLYLPVIYAHNYSSLLIISFALNFSFKYSRRMMKLSRSIKRFKDLNITLDKKVKQRTRKLQKEKNARLNFFINLAHETKTPLTLMKNYLEQYIKKRGMGGELKIIYNNLNKLFRDMEHFLDIEKIHKGIFDVQKNSIIHFSDMVYNKVILFKEIARKKKIFIKPLITNNLYINLDPMAVDRILNNIIENAVKYTEERGEIEITLEPDQKGSMITLTVKDNGIGMTKDHLKNIYNPYYRVSYKSSSQGMGVGLYIVKQIITLLKGTIKIQSVRNEGTVCTINLPLYTKQAGEEAGKPPYTEPFIALTPPKVEEEKPACDEEVQEISRILIVEDNDEMSHFLKTELSPAFHIHTSANGVEALELLETIPLPDLIISDVLMDKMGGFQFVETLAEHKKFQHIPFIFLSAKSTLEEQISGLRHGAADYIAKPFSIDVLKLKISSLLQRKRLLEKKIIDQLTGDKIESNCAKYNMTDREKEIIALIINGLETKQMAFELKIEETTVNYHLTKIRKKLNVKNKNEIAIKILS